MRDCASGCGFGRIADGRASARFAWPCDPRATSRSQVRFGGPARESHDAGRGDEHQQEQESD